MGSYASAELNRPFVERLAQRLQLSAPTVGVLIEDRLARPMMYFVGADGGIAAGRSSRATGMSAILGVRWFLRSKLEQTGA